MYVRLRVTVQNYAADVAPEELLDNILHVDAKLFTCPSNRRQQCSGTLDLRRSSPLLCETNGFGTAWWKSRFSYDGDSGELLMVSDSSGQSCSTPDGGNHGCPGFELAAMGFDVTLSALVGESGASIRRSYQQATQLEQQCDVAIDGAGRCIQPRSGGE